MAISGIKKKSTNPRLRRSRFGRTGELCPIHKEKQDNPLYKPYEGSGEEVNIIGRIRWFAREM